MNEMANLALSWAANHQQYFVGLACGFLLANPITCAKLAFSAALRIPGFGPWVAKNPDKAKAWFDAFDKAIDDCVDRYAAEQPAPVQAPK